MTASSFPLAELLAALSLATDAGNGVPPERTIRMTFLSLRMAGELGLDDRDRSDLYYASLLRFIGCTAFTYEMARMSGNEFSALEAFAQADDRNPREALHAIVAAGRGQGARQRARGIVANTLGGKRFGEYVVRADCDASARFARRFGMGQGMISILDQVYERWDGKGAPRALRGQEISIGARVLSVSLQAEIFHRLHGTDAVMEMARRRSGIWFDPDCASALERCAAGSLDRIERGSVWDDTLAGEPSPRITIGEGGVDDLAEGFADFADLKSPSLLGHSRGVAHLAAEAGRRFGLPSQDVTDLRRAALLHDVGRVAVPSLVWEKPGPLSPAEWEQVRLHAYQTERILARSAHLDALAPLAGRHHERLDGGGYHRGARASDISSAARILAAADVYQALTESRPHRPAFAPEAAVEEIQREVSSGRLDREAAEAVCSAAGEVLPKLRSAWP
ncbi:MAG: HD domain-containing phosphohydrolase, partial [Actinomycetota bacterium]